MAPLPVNGTDRWFLDYVTGTGANSITHTLMLRLPDGQDAAGGSATFLAVLNGMGAGSLWDGWKPLGMSVSRRNSDFSAPLPMSTALAAFEGTGALTGYSPTSEAIEVTFQGRSPSTGRRVDFSLYGLLIADLLDSFRLTTSVGFVAGVLAGLRGLSVSPVCIDGTSPVWYDYANLNYNSYWERRIRQG